MHSNRRSFLQRAGAIGAVATLGGLNTISAETKPTKPAGQEKKGLARGLTLLTMRRNGEFRLGAKTSEGILDVKEAADLLKLYSPATLDDMLQREEGASVQAVVEAAMKSHAAQKLFLKEENIEYGPLVTRPEKIVCVGLNYRRHAQEIKMPIPKQPVLFNKYNNSLLRHGGTIKLPSAVSTKFDYEIELVIVMGKEARDVSEKAALSCVAGYATGNDFSARDLQFETGGQWMQGKSSDGFAPLGPYFVTAEQVDPDNLNLECRVNGETRQSSNTNDLIYNCSQIISYTSARISLRPGDIIFTGTPGGVIFGGVVGGLAVSKEKYVWLKAGDKIACSLEKLGELKFDLV
ncbi:MAG TPA: fumarylacetoacetate hydrolase family protein [Terriglobales bacterium]|nr:fumarylacetoacetate hydrolase family protein [Terriglobales bacterium]